MFMLVVRDHTHDFDIGVEKGDMLHVAIAMLYLDLNLIKSAQLLVCHRISPESQVIPSSEPFSQIWSWTCDQPESDFYQYLRDTHGYTWCCQYRCFENLRPCGIERRFERNLYVLDLSQYDSDYEENDVNTVD